MNPSLQIQSLFSNNSENLILGQLGANSSVHFLGPPRGVLPIGPNGIHSIGTLPLPPLISTLQPSPLSDAEINAAIISYNYTLNHQGLASGIRCMNDTQSPIQISAVESITSLVNAQGFCNGTGLADFLPTMDDNGYMVLLREGSEILTLWACKSLPAGEQDPAYYIYLRAFTKIPGLVDGGFGLNISCTVSPIQPAIFPVTYQSISRVFSTQAPITTSAPGINFNFIEQAIYLLYIAVNLAQTATVNLVADSVEVFGNQAIRSGRYNPDEQYLRLYEAMIQGILVDDVCTASNSPHPLLIVVPQLTYIRYLYSMTPADIFHSPPPASCNRTVTGVFSAEVMGWVAMPVHIGFLMPMTILNLASLIIVLIYMARAKRGRHEFDITDPRSLVSAESIPDESDHSGWVDGVLYRSREVREYPI
jgi:hypothetical protein